MRALIKENTVLNYVKNVVVWFREPLDAFRSAQPKPIECQAFVDGISAEPVVTLISAKELPSEGEALRTLWKWPRLTAQGWRDDGDFWWAVMIVERGKVFVKPTYQ